MEEDSMLISKVAISVALIAVSAVPSFAADAMMSGASMSMMKAGEVISIMADGHMGNMTMTASDAKMEAGMMKMAKPMAGCMMFMTGKDGKTYIVDTSSAAAMAECEKMAK
jgi:hypothetical protein